MVKRQKYPLSLQYPFLILLYSVSCWLERGQRAQAGERPARGAQEQAAGVASVQARASPRRAARRGLEGGGGDCVGRRRPGDWEATCKTEPSVAICSHTVSLICSLSPLKKDLHFQSKCQSLRSIPLCCSPQIGKQSGCTCSDPASLNRASKQNASLLPASISHTDKH